MKKVLLFLLLAASFLSFSQTVPHKINYQAVARHADGTAITDKTILIRFRLLQTSASGTEVFNESQSLSTGPLGVFSHQIGATSNSLSAVNWSAGPYFLEVAIDTTNTGSQFILMGTQELVSTPYALYAGSAPSPSVSFNSLSNVLNVGSNSVTLNGASASPSTSINTSGATTSALNGYTYNIHTPSVTVSAAEISQGSALGLAQMAGSYPNFSVIVAPTVVYNPTVGVLQFLSNSLFSPSYNYTYNITPKLDLSPGNVLSVGPPSNSIQLSGGSAPDVTVTSSSSGLVVTPVGPNNFDLSSAITFTGSGGTTVTGGPNYTISSSSSSFSLTGDGAATVTPSGNNYTVNVLPTIVSSGTGISVSGTAPNFTVNSLVSTPTITGTGMANVNSVANVHTIDVPTTSLSSGTGINVTGSAPNFTVNSLVSTPTITGTGMASVNSVGNVHTIDVPTTSLSSGTGINVTGSAPNFTVNSLATTPTVTGTGMANVNSVGNVHTIDVPTTSLSSGTGISISGSAPNFTINSTVPTISVSGTGAAAVTALGNNYNVSVPVTTITGGALFYPSGLLQVMGAYPNYSLLVAPSIVYSQQTGSLTLSNQPLTTPTYTYSYDITPSLTNTNNVIQSGPTSNSVAIISPAAQAFVISGSGLAALAGVVFTQGSFVKQSASSEIDVFVHCKALMSVGLGAFTYEIVIDGNVSLVSTSHVSDGALLSATSDYITMRGVFSGLSAGSHTIGIKVTGSVALGVNLNNNGAGPAKLILKETY